MWVWTVHPTIQVYTNFNGTSKDLLGSGKLSSSWKDIPKISGVLQWAWSVEAKCRSCTFHAGIIVLMYMKYWIVVLFSQAVISFVIRSYFIQENKYKEAIGFYEPIVKKHYDNVRIFKITCMLLLYEGHLHALFIVASWVFLLLIDT